MLTRLVKASDLGLLVEPKFYVVALICLGVTNTYNTWVLYYVPHLQAKDISPQVAAALTSVGAVGYLIGTVIWAPFIDRGIVKCSTGLIICSLLTTLSLVVDPWVDDVLGQGVLTLLWGLNIAPIYPLSETLVRDVFGSDRLSSLLGKLSMMYSIPRQIAGFLPGWLYDSYGNYDWAFVVIGIMQTLSILPLVVSKIYQCYKGFVMKMESSE